MANLQYLNEVKIILNAFEDSEIMAHQFLHGLLSTNIFEDHPITRILSRLCRHIMQGRF